MQQIPGTAIQNARTSFVGDHMNRDGYHLDLKIGRYTAACTWFEKIFERNVVGNPYYPEALLNTEYTLTLSLDAVENCLVGPAEYQYVTIQVTDRISCPVWWSKRSAGSGSKSRPWSSVASGPDYGIN